MLLHARALLASSPQGTTAYIQADLRDTGTILAEAAGVLDFGQPVAVLLLGVLHCIPDQDDPAAIVARLMAAVQAGSYLAIAHPASDVATEQMTRSMGEYNKQAAGPGHRPQLRRGLPVLRQGLERRRARRRSAAPVAARNRRGRPGPRASQLRRGRTQTLGAASGTGQKPKCAAST